jgi:hypothetical protein
MSTCQIYTRDGQRKIYCFAAGTEHAWAFSMNAKEWVKAPVCRPCIASFRQNNPHWFRGVHPLEAVCLHKAAVWVDAPPRSWCALPGEHMTTWDVEEALRLCRVPQVTDPGERTTSPVEPASCAAHQPRSVTSGQAQSGQRSCPCPLPAGTPAPRGCAGVSSGGAPSGSALRSSAV